MTIPCTGSRRFRLGAALALAGLVGLPAASLAGEHDHSSQALTFFLSGRGIARDGQLPADQKSSEGQFTADIVIGLKHNRLRYLGEFVLERAEHEFERIQVGWEPTENSTLWLGRFHQPASVWNLFYHHGAYLQTSVTRPWIEGWEDDGGIIPQHVVGSLYESQFELSGGRGLHLAVGLGRPPVLLDTQLRPWEQTGHSGVAAGSHAAARLEWLPDPVGEDAVGIIASHARVATHRSAPALGPLFNQDVFGGFFSLTRGRSRAIGAVFHMRLGPGDGTWASAQLRSHVADYLQYSFNVTPHWTLYARQEAFSNAAASSYVGAFTGVQSNRGLLGARFELPHKQALTIEAGQAQVLTGGLVREASLQWSAAWP